MIRILGIDPGLAETGWGIIDATETRYLHIGHGTITTPPDWHLGKRLYTIASSIREIINQYRPEKSAMEALFFTKNISSAIPVAQSCGALLVVLEELDLEVSIFSPPEIKLALTGNGKSEKYQVQEMVKLLLGLSQNLHSSHAADALAAAVCCRHHTGGPCYTQ